MSIILALMLSYKVFAFWNDPEDIDFGNTAKRIELNDNGLNYHLTTDTGKVEEFLSENGIKLSEYDKITPEKNATIYSGMNVIIRRASRIKIEVDGKKTENYTLERNIEAALIENGVKLERLDKTSPDKNLPVSDNMTVIVTRINIEEVTKQEKIEFKTTVKNDSKMGWREKKVETPGEEGIREVRYRITYKNGKEISKTTLEKKVVKEPVTQVETQGTYVKTGKTHNGQGTWYSFKGGLYAASPWLPMGSYAKVTNTANGKSVIVQINDRGPFGPGRIIDLDKVAFAKIASIGAGVIGVKVEEVLN